MHISNQGFKMYAIDLTAFIASLIKLLVSAQPSMCTFTCTALHRNLLSPGSNAVAFETQQKGWRCSTTCNVYLHGDGWCMMLVSELCS